MPVVLPLIPSVPHYDVGVTLDGTPYIVEVHWNDRDSSWFFSLLDDEGDPIFAGRKIVLGTPIGHRCRDARKPPGAFLVQDLAGTDRDATIDDLGVRVMVVYFTAADIAAAGL